MQTCSPMPPKVMFSLVMAACVLASAVCGAQESAPAGVSQEGASLGGTVLDANGSMLPGARIEITIAGVDLVETSPSAAWGSRSASVCVDG